MTRNWPAWPNQVLCGQLAFTSTSTFTLSMPTGKLRSQHPPLDSEALICTILANKAALAASPEGHKLRHFPNRYRGRQVAGRRFLFVDRQQLSGPPSAAICWCGCPLLMFPKASCQDGAAWRMQRWGRLWSPGGKRLVPQLRVEGTAVPTQDLLAHPERK